MKSFRNANAEMINEIFLFHTLFSRAARNGSFSALSFVVSPPTSARAMSESSRIFISKNERSPSACRSAGSSSRRRLRPKIQMNDFQALNLK